MNGLLKIANDEGIKIDLFPMNEVKSVSVPKAIALNPNKIKSNRELKVILGHELGHHKRNAFYTVKSSLKTRGWQEERATRWAVDTLLPADKIKDAFEKGHTEVWQLAEYFDVTEDFIRDAVRVHKLKGQL
ncbi:MAG: ImmA/IrrE family metallo-endopeptidase [Clostridia bacterium]|nr:ImmA/IrrE family metallo-endopeptidase [Clostridia bacterium]MBQ3462097.1 ImmA/IrrE family metallo-endopeptidase [Clostridia bacterium]MBR0470988.1 ImmA/IrrE family metallo-endopeptidase [Clostridia bacterium]